MNTTFIIIRIFFSLMDNWIYFSCRCCVLVSERIEFTFLGLELFHQGVIRSGIRQLAQVAIAHFGRFSRELTEHSQIHQGVGVVRVFLEGLLQSRVRLFVFALTDKAIGLAVEQQGRRCVLVGQLLEGVVGLLKLISSLDTKNENTLS